MGSKKKRNKEPADKEAPAKKNLWPRLSFKWPEFKWPETALKVAVRPEFKKAALELSALWYVFFLAVIVSAVFCSQFYLSRIAAGQEQWLGAVFGILLIGALLFLLAVMVLTIFVPPFCFSIKEAVAFLDPGADKVADYKGFNQDSPRVSLGAWLKSRGRRYHVFPWRAEISNVETWIFKDCGLRLRLNYFQVELSGSASQLLEKYGSWNELRQKLAERVANVLNEAAYQVYVRDGNSVFRVLKEAPGDALGFLSLVDHFERLCQERFGNEFFALIGYGQFSLSAGLLGGKKHLQDEDC